MTFSTSLTGLNAAQTELSALSNNIANAGTSGFKKSRVEFGDIVTRSATQASNSVNGVGVAIAAVKQQFAQGGYQTSSNALDLSIGGQGFFLVKGGAEAGDSLFLSRNGAFSVDADRWVIDNEGRRLQVLPTTADGAATAIGLSALQPLRLPLTSGIPSATAAARVVLSLPAAADPPAPAFARDNPASYNGAAGITLFDAQGNASALTLYYVRVPSPPGDTGKYWDVRMFRGDAEILPDGSPTPLQLGFDEDGVLLAPTGPVLTTGGFTLSHADSAIAPGPFAALFSEQDGYAPGRLEGVGIDLAGVVRASFSNGETIAIGKLALGNVANPQGLKQTGNVSWALAPSSGPLVVGEAGSSGFGTVVSGSLERSNVDLTEELVGLISAQRHFQANARAIETASTLLQSIIQLRS